MKRPDGPKAPPWLQKLQYTLDPLGFMETAARYGDIFNAPIIGNADTLLLVSQPSAVQQIFANDTKQFAAPSNQLLRPLVGDHSLLVLEGDRHRRDRKLLLPPFHGDRMRSYGQAIMDLADKAFSRLAPNQSFTARSLAQDISLEVILRVVFGLSEGEQFYQLKQLITTLMDLFQYPVLAGLLFFPSLQKDLGPRSPWGYVRQLQRQIDQLLYAEIQARRQHPDPA